MTTNKYISIGIDLQLGIRLEDYEYQEAESYEFNDNYFIVNHKRGGKILYNHKYIKRISINEMK